MPNLNNQSASCAPPSRFKEAIREKQARDRYRYKENTNEASSSIQQYSSDSENSAEHFEFDDSVPCPWAQEWRQQTNSEWISEFSHNQDTANNNSNYNWIDEYNNNINWEKEAADDWINEFHQQQEGEEYDKGEHLKESAAELLSRMDLDDEKIRNSQFVAYLRRLAAGEPGDAVSRQAQIRAQESFSEWREEFRKAIDPLVSQEDADWELWKKDWERYEANGIGYENFSRHEFRVYQFSPNNPFLNNHPISSSALSHRDRILAVEAQVQTSPTAQLWSTLGQLQSENEMDIQAIAAFQEALRLDAGLPSALLGMALACVNERCLPEAYECIESWLKRNPRYSAIPVNNVQAGNRNSELLRCFLSINSEGDADALLLTSVLQNLAGNSQFAEQSMRNAAQSRPNNPSLWLRLGATLANSGRYQEALALYDQAASLGADNPRLYYNRAISYMSSDRYPEAQRELVRGIQTQLAVETFQGVRPELLNSYRTIWTTLRLLCELRGGGNDELIYAAELRDLKPFLYH